MYLGQNLKVAERERNDVRDRVNLIVRQFDEGEGVVREDRERDQIQG